MSPSLFAALSLLAPLQVQMDGRLVHVDNEPTHVALVSLDETKGCELLEVHQGYVRLPQPEGAPLELDFEGEALLWMVADHDSDGHEDLVVLVDGKRLDKLVVSANPPSLYWEPLLENLSDINMVPRGLRTASFIRDLDGDGLQDILVPVAEKVQLWFGKGAGKFRKGPLLGVASSLHLRAWGPEKKGLMHRVGRSMTIPAIKMNDISGDQIPDLLVTDEHLVQQYISGPDGLPELPTATVDWSKFRNRLPEIKFDTGNIASISKYALFEEWSDLNADGALDLVVLSGGTVIIYMGSGKGLDLRRPKDQLPTRGNVLYATTSFVDSDEYPDLVLLRVEDISLMRLLSVLVMDISITFDILAYKGRGDGRFEKRPMKESKSIKLKVPNLSSLIKEEETIEDARQAIYRIADFDGDGRSTDLVALSPTGVLKTYLDVVSHPDLLDDLAERKIREILISSSVIELNAETIARWALGRTSLLASLVDGGMVAHVAAFSPDSEVEAPQAMAVRDVDGDGADEIILFRRVELESGDPGLRGFIFDPGAP